MEPTQDIRLKLQQRKLAREEKQEEKKLDTSNKENAAPHGIKPNRPIRTGRGRGFLFQRQNTKLSPVRKSLIFLVSKP